MCEGIRGIFAFFLWQGFAFGNLGENKPRTQRAAPVAQPNSKVMIHLYLWTCTHFLDFLHKIIILNIISGVKFDKEKFDWSENFETNLTGETWIKGWDPLLAESCPVIVIQINIINKDFRKLAFQGFQWKHFISFKVFQ